LSSDFSDIFLQQAEYRSLSDRCGFLMMSSSPGLREAAAV